MVALLLYALLCIDNFKQKPHVDFDQLCQQQVYEHEALLLSHLCVFLGYSFSFFEMFFYYYILYIAYKKHYACAHHLAFVFLCPSFISFPNINRNWLVNSILCSIQLPLLYNRLKITAPTFTIDMCVNFELSLAKPFVNKTNFAMCDVKQL